MYPVYALQVYAHVQRGWIDVASPAPSNRPHHYDVLRKAFERLVSNAKEGASPNQAPIGYQIVIKSRSSWIDRWTNGKVYDDQAAKRDAALPVQFSRGRSKLFKD